MSKAKLKEGENDGEPRSPGGTMTGRHVTVGKGLCLGIQASSWEWLPQKRCFRVKQLSWGLG